MTDSCPICGNKVKQNESLVAAPGCAMHRCKPSTVRRIDAAMQTERMTVGHESYHNRLSQGFAMLADDDHGG